MPTMTKNEALKILRQPAEERQKKRAQKKAAANRFYCMNSLLGNQCMFYVVLGGRMTGKSYSGAEFLIRQKRELGDQCKNYWLRISQTSVDLMKQNKCKSFIDPDLQRKYKLDLSSKGMYILNKKPDGKKEDFMTVMALGEFGKLKGVGFYDKDFQGWTNIVLDEFMLEQGEKRTSFDILYNFVGMVENIARTTKSKIRIFLFGNTLEECSSILKAFNFIPQQFGRFYLHRWNKYTQKRELYCVIDNLEPTEEYLKDRYGSAADILGGGAMSNYTNEMTQDLSCVVATRLRRPTGIIKFSTRTSDWFTIWDGNVIKRWNKEMVNNDFAMRPNLQTTFNLDKKGFILDAYDARAFRFRSLIDQQYFADAMKRLRA